MDLVRVRDWIPERNLVPWIEILAHIGQDEIHPDEADGIAVRLQPTDAETGTWFELELNQLRLRVARDVGTSVLIVEVDAPASLAVQVEIAIEILKNYQLQRSTAG